MLTDEQCMKFRQMPGSFNEMVRAIYAAGRRDGMEEAAKIVENMPYEPEGAASDHEENISEAIRAQGGNAWQPDR